MTLDLLCDADRCPLDVFHQGFRCERLGEISKATRLDRCHARARVVLPRDENDRQAYAGGLQVMVHINPRPITNIDVEDGANRFFKIAVLLKRIG